MKHGDLQDIRDTLPYLLDGQQEDVHKTETRFGKPTGYGMLLTNGTGSGKTFSGLGIIKRFALQGKTSVIVVVPSDKIAADWVGSATALGLNISKLDDTGSNGQGIVITTYANFGQNKTLADRDWDLIVHDEAHYLSQEKHGSETTFLETLRALALHPDGIFQRHLMLNRQLVAKAEVIEAEIKDIADANKAYYRNSSKTEAERKAFQTRAARLDKLQAELAPINTELQKRAEAVRADVLARQGAARPRAQFLSATPFAYEKSVGWANGFLFDYTDAQAEKTGGYNGPTPQQRFMMQHFGYRMRYGKLTEPDAQVDRGLMQRQFNAWLRKQGVLSTRMLDVPHDYDRRFVLIDSKVGVRIDQALSWISERGNELAQGQPNAPNGYRLLGAKINESFDYLSRRYLLEAIKAGAAVKDAKAHMAMGRKVVVFHDYKKGGGFNPFKFDEVREGDVSDPEVAMVREVYNQALREFNTEFKDLVQTPFETMPSPIEVFKREFQNLLVFNGDVPPKTRRKNVETFQDDATGAQVILVQSAAGKEGISLHDTSGSHQRVMLNLGQPTQPTTAIQEEGRTYRVGQASNAIFRYYNTGTNWERWAFATTIANRASAAENLALGEQARALKDGFIAAFEEADEYPAGHEGEGRGGKERDRAANDALTQFDRAKAFYFGTEKKSSRTKSQEGKDYFATPEPLGLKMVEWADVRGGEHVLEPSAGHGAIARWFPEHVDKVAIEPSNDLVSRLAMVFDGKIVSDAFERHHLVNKYDAIVMNPPFGVGGKTAIEHLEKAYAHLADGGRIVAIIPTGPAADKRFDEWFHGERERAIAPVVEHAGGKVYRGDTVHTNYSWARNGVVVGIRNDGHTKTLMVKTPGVVSPVAIPQQDVTGVEPTGPRKEVYKPADGLQMVADIKLPSATFQRAGTGVMTRVVVLERTNATVQQVQRDYTGADGIAEFFNRIEDAAVPDRAKPREAEDSERVTVEAEKKTAAAPAPELLPDTGGLPILEYTTQKGKKLLGVVRTDLKRAQAEAIDPFAFIWKEKGGFFIRLKYLPRSGATPTAAPTAPAAAPVPAAAPAVDRSTPQKWWDTANAAERQHMIVRAGRPELAKVFSPLTWDKLSANLQARVATKLEMVLPEAPLKPVTPQVSPAAPKTRAEAASVSMARYFQPGAIVEGYGGGMDEVLEFIPADSSGRWSVRVHHVRRVGDDWVREGRPQDARMHSTMPTSRELAKGPVADVAYAPGDQVKYTERGQVKTYPSAPARGTPPAGVAQAESLNPDMATEEVFDHTRPEMRQARSAAQWLSQNATEEWQRDLAARFVPVLDANLPLHFLEVGKSYDLPRQVSLLFRGNAAAVSFVNSSTGDGDLYFRPIGGRVTQPTLLHELLHQATLRALRLGRAAVAVKELDNIRNSVVIELRDLASKSGVSQETRDNASFFADVIDDNDELLAYGLTSKTFRQWAQHMTAKGRFNGVKELQQENNLEHDADRTHPDPEPLTLWQRFVDAVRSLLGLDRKHRDNLEKLLADAAENRREFITKNTPPNLSQRLDELLNDVMAIQRTSGKQDYVAPQPMVPVAKSTQQLSQVDTSEFKRWFGDSKVVDASGNPLVVYHGSDKDITEFEPGRRDPGVWFTSRKETAAGYAKGNTPALYKVYLSIKNPLVADFSNWSGSGPITVEGIDFESNVDIAKHAQRTGRDGVNFPSGNFSEDDNTWVAFRPEQIKSATGNRGTFDPDNADVRAMMPPPVPPAQPPGPPPYPASVPMPKPKPSADPVLASAMRKAGMRTPAPLAERIRDAFDRAQQVLRDRNGLKTAAAAAGREFQQGALDQFAGLRQAVRREVGDLPAEQDPYITVRLANGGASAVMRGLLMHGQAKWADNGQHLEKIEGTKGLLDILAPLGDDLHAFFGWMIGNRAARLLKEGRENNFTEAEIQRLQALGVGKEAMFKTVAAEYAAFKRSVLDIAQDAGLIDPEGRRVWDQADYIPFYRQINERSVFSATGHKGLSGQTSGIRTLRGGESELNDPMENLLMNFSRLVDASLKNNALRKTIDVLGDGDVIARVGYDMKRDIVPNTEVKRVLRDQGVPEAVMATIDPSVFAGMSKMWAIQPPQDPDVIRVMVDGKPRFYRVGDPLLLRSLTSFIPFDFPGLATMRAFKRVLTATVTATPEFMARNFIRDSVAAHMITRDGFNPMKSLQGIVKSYTETGAGEAMLFAGASFQSGNINANDPEGTANAMRRALRAKGMNAAAVDSFLGTVVDKGFAGWEKYRRAGEAIENANREAVYEAALRAGKSATEAAFEAKDLMDFSLRGSWAAYQILADVVPFLNARVQGMYRLGRSDPKRLLRYGLLMTMLTLVLAAANDGEEWYEELPDWDKDTYWHVMIGGQHFRFPKPFELGVAFATIPERVGRYVKGLDSGKKAGRRLWKNVEDQLAMDPVPQMFRPAANVWANRDTFRDSPIETPADEGKLASERFSANTSATARALTQVAPGLTDAVGISPKQIEYLVGGYLGTAGLYALGLSDMAVRAYQGGPARASLRADDLPVVKAFYRELPNRGTVFESDLYRLRDDLQKIYNSVRARQRVGDDAGAQAIAERNAKELEAYGVVAGAAKRLSATQRQMDAVQRDPNLTPQEKRAQLDELQRNKNVTARQAMQQPQVRTIQ